MVNAIKLLLGMVAGVGLCAATTGTARADVTGTVENAIKVVGNPGNFVADVTVNYTFTNHDLITRVVNMKSKTVITEFDYTVGLPNPPEKQNTVQSGFGINTLSDTQHYTFPYSYPQYTYICTSESEWGTANPTQVDKDTDPVVQ